MSLVIAGNNICVVKILVWSTEAANTPSLAVKQQLLELALSLLMSNIACNCSSYAAYLPEG